MVLTSQINIAGRLFPQIRYELSRNSIFRSFSKYKSLIQYKLTSDIFLNEVRSLQKYDSSEVQCSSDFENVSWFDAIEYCNRGNSNVDLVEIEMVNTYRGGIYEVTQKDLNAEARPPLKKKF